MGNEELLGNIATIAIVLGKEVEQCLGSSPKVSARYRALPMSFPSLICMMDTVASASSSHKRHNRDSQWRNPVPVVLGHRFQCDEQIPLLWLQARISSPWQASIISSFTCRIRSSSFPCKKCPHLFNMTCVLLFGHQAGAWPTAPPDMVVEAWTVALP